MTEKTLEMTTDFDYDNLAEVCELGDILDFGKVFLPVLYALVFAFGLVGNLLVVFALTNGGKKKSITDIYLLNLAFSDLLLVISLPVWIHYVVGDRHLGNILCKSASALFFIGLFGGMFFVTVISIDRFLAIVRAAGSIHSRTVQHGVSTSLGVWTVAILAAVPQFMYTEQVGGECTGNYPEVLQHMWPMLRNLEANLFGFLFPFLIMSYCYLRILKTLLFCKNHKKGRAAKLILMVVVVFFIFWTPYNVLVCLETLNHYNFFTSCTLKRHLRFGLSVTETIALVHCCLNPFIYAFAGEKFRRYLYVLYVKCRAVFCGLDPRLGIPQAEVSLSKRESVMSSNFTSFSVDPEHSSLF
ncbi:CX3C chemokine receptor 1 [Tachyglossus aculeatus]|uniref:CX3C chemokine receptor 1 n=1 Tax=Tachyglossus aculeatus TaxID=9261 RepID=UPI0018F2A578|nr:CX3C chemokine receptor 1 [Tachyglossus aculeatus]XP_038628186.1 CX3C chemokine receptor 1 [Tachyglossus aculeatus]XP_038628194.1 CX3C chemokine receptor 1 [Tachyglossus aculeatus]